MITPRVEIDLEKIAHNAKTLRALYASKSIEVVGVTKGVCGDPAIAATLVDSGITTLADSRIANIRKMRDAGIQAKFWLLRTPFLNQCKEVIRYADVSLNSEITVIKRLSKFAREYGTIHEIILMIEMGDLREGLMPSDVEDVVEQVLQLKGIELAGIGTNLGCFGGIKPDAEKMGSLSAIAQAIEDKFLFPLKVISGGNSANYSWFMSTQDAGKVNNLRLGESIYLGCETLDRKPIPKLYTDAFSLVAEVIESKVKPSVPYGEVGQDAFGNLPVFQDKGLMRRAILGVGLQDVLTSGLTSEPDISIIGSNSDHTIVWVNQEDLKVGSEVKFNLNYGALLSAMNSPYVIKRYEPSECSRILFNGREKRPASQAAVSDGRDQGRSLSHEKP